MFRTFSIMTLIGVATISAAYAQSEQPIEAKIPFGFTVRDTTLSAGTYRLTYNNSAHSLSLLGLDQNSQGAFVTAQPASVSGSFETPARLVFDCYGKACYLARVWQGAIGAGRVLEVPESEHRRALAFDTRVVSITIPAK